MDTLTVTAAGETATAQFTVQSTPTQRLLIGASITAETGHQGVKWDAGRVYRDAKADEAIKTYGAKRILYSDPTRTRTPAAVKTDMLRIVSLANAQGITDFAIDYCYDNEADRQYTADADIATFKANFKAVATAVHTVPGAQMWMNLTRNGISNGNNDKFVTADMLSSIDGLAINCYADNLEKNPIVYSTNWSWLTDMFTWVAAKGVKQVAGWETGHRADSAQPNGRPTWAQAMAVNYEKLAKAQGLAPVALSWWDGITTATRDTRLVTDQPKTRDAWKSALV